MNSFKQTLSAAIACVMFISILPLSISASDTSISEEIVQADTFSKETDRIFKDIAPDSALYECTKALYEEGIMPGYDDGCFHPERYVTDMTVAYVMYNFFREDVPEDFSKISQVTLIEPESFYYNSYAWLLNEGAANVYTNEYIFEGRSRSIVTVNLYRVISANNITLEKVSEPDEFTDDEYNKWIWYYEAAEAFRNAGIIKADIDGHFRPNDVMTNGELAEIVYRLYKATELSPITDMPSPMPSVCDHRIKSEEAVQPTCTEQGYKVNKCFCCGETYNSDFVKALGHDYPYWIPVSVPTCESVGMRVRVCDRCEEVDMQGFPVLTDSLSVFSDVKQEWYKPYVDYVYTRGVMLGTSEDMFSPNTDLSRAMLVTVLWRIEGEPESEYSSSFSDVPSGEWYSKAVAWAAENGIVYGTSDTTFEPNAKIKRQDLVTMFYRYAKYYKKYDTTAYLRIDEIYDGYKMSYYAYDAMSWAVAMGIINGKDGYLAPNDTATRAEFSAVFMRFDLQY